MLHDYENDQCNASVGAGSHLSATLFLFINIRFSIVYL